MENEDSTLVGTVMARKTKKKVPRGGQEISSFLQGHTTWKADTIQNIIAVGRFGNLADVVLLFRADLIVPWIHKDRAAAVIVAAHLNLSWVDEDPFLTLQAADMAAGMMHGDEVKIVCAEVQEKRPPMKSPSLQSQYVQQYVQLSRAAEQNSGEEPAPDDSQNNRLTDTKRYYARRTGKTYKQMIQDDRSQPGNAEHPAPEEIIQDDRSQPGNAEHPAPEEMIQDDRSHPGNAEHPAQEEMNQDDRSQPGDAEHPEK